MVRSLISKWYLITIGVFLTNLSFSQTTIFSESGGGTTAGWSYIENSGSQPIDKGSYWLVESGSTSDYVITASYDLCAYASATFTIDVATYGSGTANPAIVEVSYDGGATYTDNFTTNTPSSSSYIAGGTFTLSQTSAQVVIRISNAGTSGRGVRLRNLELTATGSGSCGGTHTVTFDGNGNDGGSMSNQTASSPTALTANGYTQTGCAFTGWNTASDGSGTSYADGATYSFGADITLYAQWSCSGGNCASETFSNIGTSGSYGTKTWTGDDGVGWTATDAREDQTLTGKAITLRNGSLTNDTPYPNGCGVLTFDYARVFSGNSTLKVFVNGTQYGADITVSSTASTTWSMAINVSGNVSIELRNSGNRTIIDNLSWTCFAACTGPSTQASFTSFSSVNSTSFDINFTAGNGNGRIVVISAGSAVSSAPTSGTTYTANTVFGSGSDISGGSGDYVVYDGTGTSVTVTGLTANTTYYVTIFEYATGGSTDPCYNTSTTGNTGNTTTPCAAVAEPTSPSSGISFTNVGCDGFQIDWTSGNGANRIFVVSSAAITGNPSDQTAYTASATYGSGSTLNAGEYVVYNGSGNSVTVTGLSINTTYFVEIFEYNGTIANCDENYLISSTVTSSQTTLSACTNPELTGILVDACGGSSEGINEFFTFDNGTSALNVDDITVTFPSAGTYCNTSCSAGFVTNSTFVNQLNTTAGCAGLFVEADPIPAGASVIVFTGSNPTYAFDFSGLCGSGPYYALLLDNTSTSGRFANYNSTCSNRTLTVDFNGTTDAVTYDRCLLSHADGDYVSFASDGTATYANDGCTPTATLPIELLDFNGKSYQDYNELYWHTATEINNDYFEVQKSIDGLEFYKIGTIKGAGNSSTTLSYSLKDKAPESINYYRLKQVDFDGTTSFSKTIVLKGNLQIEVQIYQDETNFSIVLGRNEPVTIQVMNAMGQIVYSNQMIGAHSIAKSQFSGGIYFVRIQNESFTETYKVIF